ncbi:hypothetical protein [Streptomyces sp. NPDC101455]|uniref:hypothetical protein n=1 Tax=Streptomyces sp. NPDC101455 TaxID=3366142 RepID=UPI003820ACC0
MKSWRSARRAARAAIRRIAERYMRRGSIQAMPDAGHTPESVTVHAQHSPRSTAFDAVRKKKLTWDQKPDTPTVTLGLAA